MNRFASIQVFVAVARCGSFTQAAASLNTSKSYVSRKVGELEARLDAQLLIRTTRKVSLTEEGRAFYQRCLHIFDSLEEAEQAVIDLKEKPIGHLRITVAGAFGEDFIVPVAVKYMQMHTGLSVEVDFNNRVVDLISEGYDLAIRAAGTLKDSSLIARRVTHRDLLTCASPAYLQSSGTPQTIAELVNHNCLIGTLPTWRFREGVRDFDIRIQGNWRSNNGKSLVYAACQGLGIVQLPSFYVKSPIADNALVTILDEYKPRETAVWAVYPHNRHLSAKVRLFINMLVEYFADGTAVSM